MCTCGVVWIQCMCLCVHCFITRVYPHECTLECICKTSDYEAFVIVLLCIPNFTSVFLVSQWYSIHKIVCFRYISIAMHQTIIFRQYIYTHICTQNNGNTNTYKWKCNSVKRQLFFLFRTIYYIRCRMNATTPESTFVWSTGTDTQSTLSYFLRPQRLWIVDTELKLFLIRGANVRAHTTSVSSHSSLTTGDSSGCRRCIYMRVCDLYKWWMLYLCEPSLLFGSYLDAMCVRAHTHTHWKKKMGIRGDQFCSDKIISIWNFSVNVLRPAIVMWRKIEKEIHSDGNSPMKFNLPYRFSTFACHLHHHQSSEHVQITSSKAFTLRYSHQHDGIAFVIYIKIHVCRMEAHE